MGPARFSGVAFAAAFAVLVIGVFLALGGAAYAQSNPSSAEDQYDTKVVSVTVDKAESVTETQADVESQVDVESQIEVESATAEALPNTGLSLLVTALVGGALVAVGLGLRRRERKR